MLTLTNWKAFADAYVPHAGKTYGYAGQSLSGRVPEAARHIAGITLDLVRGGAVQQNDAMAGHRVVILQPAPPPAGNAIVIVDADYQRALAKATLKEKANTEMEFKKTVATILCDILSRSAQNVRDIINGDVALQNLVLAGDILAIWARLTN